MSKNKSEFTVRNDMDVWLCPKKGKIAPTERENNIFIVALILAFALLIIFVGYVPIQGSSMMPTIQSKGDNVIVLRHLITPDYGDMVILNNSKRDLDGSTHELLIKRVVAKGRDTISMLPSTEAGEQNKIVLKVNGVVVDEPYIDSMIVGKVTKTQDEIIVPEGYVYVLGDNRSVSLDSRTFGPVPLNIVDGVVVMAFGSGGIRFY